MKKRKIQAVAAEIARTMKIVVSVFALYISINGCTSTEKAKPSYDIRERSVLLQKQLNRISSLNLRVSEALTIPIFEEIKKKPATQEIPKQEILEELKAINERTSYSLGRVIRALDKDTEKNSELQVLLEEYSSACKAKSLK
ncbi:MAG: hypothetical protein GY866_14335 [Proteobacteria bacterium]|nr:hypothetical protein [Pseudomonadota bacterium]